jgi:hypothetical protein
MDFMGISWEFHGNFIFEATKMGFHVNFMGNSWILSI